MSQFKKNIESLPSVDQLAGLEIMAVNSELPIVVIQNKPGKSGSLAVYNYLHNKFGGVTPESALCGLELFGEYTEEAKLNPGSHPNIDFLIGVINEDMEYQIKLIAK
ncbi:MAG: DUF2322 family protein [Gammaproteobacteria bacterium]|nr:DUF2322 family protein [Gammaproteobacteria bacterium]